MPTEAQIEVNKASARAAVANRWWGPDDSRTLALRAEFHLAKALNHVDQMKTHLRELTADQRAQVFAALNKEDQS